MQNNTKTFGDRIKSARKEQDLTQQELADKLDVSQAYINNLEHDRTNPTVKQLRRIFNALDTPLDL